MINTNERKMILVYSQYHCFLVINPIHEVDEMFLDSGEDKRTYCLKNLPQYTKLTHIHVQASSVCSWSRHSESL